MPLRHLCRSHAAGDGSAPRSILRALHCSLAKAGDRFDEIERLCCRRFFSDTFVPSKGSRIRPDNSPENTAKAPGDRPSTPGGPLREHHLLNIPVVGLDAENAPAGSQRLFDRPQLDFRTIRSRSGPGLRRSFGSQERSRASRVSEFNSPPPLRLLQRRAARRVQPPCGRAAGIAGSASSGRTSIANREPATRRSETTAISQPCKRADAVVAPVAG